MVIEVKCKDQATASEISYKLCEQLVGNEDYIENRIGVSDSDSDGRFIIWCDDGCVSDPTIKLII